MPSKKDYSLEKARNDDNIERFAEEHPSKTNRGLFGKLLNLMEKGKPSKNSKAGGQT